MSDFWVKKCVLYTRRYGIYIKDLHHEFCQRQGYSLHSTLSDVHFGMFPVGSFIIHVFRTAFKDSRGIFRTAISLRTHRVYVLSPCFDEESDLDGKSTRLKFKTKRSFFGKGKTQGIWSRAVSRSGSMVPLQPVFVCTEVTKVLKWSEFHNKNTFRQELVRVDAQSWVLLATAARGEPIDLPLQMKTGTNVHQIQTFCTKKPVHMWLHVQLLGSFSECNLRFQSRQSRIPLLRDQRSMFLLSQAKCKQAFFLRQALHWTGHPLLFNLQPTDLNSLSVSGNCATRSGFF